MRQINDIHELYENLLNSVLECDDTLQGREGIRNLLFMNDLYLANKMCSVSAWEELKTILEDKLKHFVNK